MAKHSVTGEKVQQNKQYNCTDPFLPFLPLTPSFGGVDVFTNVAASPPTTKRP